MIRVTARIRTILTSTLFSMVAGVVLNATPLFAAAADETQDTSQAARVPSERHRHGPPGNGFYYSHPKIETADPGKGAISPTAVGLQGIICLGNGTEIARMNARIITVNVRLLQRDSSLCRISHV